MDGFDPQDVIRVFQDTITNHYFDMKGRVRRRDFWYFVLGCVVVSIVAAILSVFLHIIGPIVSLALLLPTAGMGARRLQDVGRPGSMVWLFIIPSAIMQVLTLLTWMSGPFGALGFLYFFFTIGWLINLVALAGLIMMIYFGVQAGNVGPNQYGPDPKGAAAPAPATA